MSDVDTRGRQVDPTEELYRLITTPAFWVSSEGRPSSAAFDKPKFSVNIASLTTVSETTRQLRELLRQPDGGIVAFNCGRARELEFDARQEIDEAHPDNAAHAHVYDEGANSSRKRRAKLLAQVCTVELTPSF